MQPNRECLEYNGHTKHPLIVTHTMLCLFAEVRFTWISNFSRAYQDLTLTEKLATGEFLFRYHPMTHISAFVHLYLFCHKCESVQRVFSIIDYIVETCHSIMRFNPYVAGG